MANDQSYIANRLRGVQTTVYFPLVTWSATDPSDSLVTAPAVHAAGDTKISKDGAAFANTTNGFTHTGSGVYALVLTATEMDADTVAVVVVDQSGPKVWKDRVLMLENTPLRSGILRQSVAQAGAAGSITLDAGASATNDFYNGALVALVSGTGAGQARVIRDYTGASKVAAVGRNWVTNPDATTGFVVLAGGEVELDPFGVDDVWDDSEGAEPSAPIASTSTMRLILQHFKRWAFNRGTATADARVVMKDDSVTPLDTQVFLTDGTTSDRSKAQ
jgi:hypothetical protein